jgi:gliding motility-associated-like protein
MLPEYTFRLWSFFLSFALLVLSFSVRSQSAEIGNAADNESSNAICADDAGNYFIGGVRNNKSLIIRQNAAHAIVWSRELSFSANTGLIPEVSFIDVIGDTVFGCGMLRNGTTVAGATCFKLNAQTGTPYWMKTMTSPAASYYTGMRYANGLFMLVGGTFSPSDAPFNDGLITGVSSQTGGVLWQTPLIGLGFPGYNNDYLDDFYNCSEIINGKLFITGRSYVNGAASSNMRTLLIGVDVTGNIILNRYLLFDIASLSPVNRFYGQAIEFDGTDSLVVTYLGDDMCTGSCNDFKTGLLKCDLLGNIGYARYYDIPGVTIEIPRTINVTPQGYLIFGQVDTGLPTHHTFALTTDKQGHVLDCVRMTPSSGTYSIYSGIGNLGSGNSSYRNGIHYLVATHLDGTDKNIRKFLLNDDLDDVMECAQLQHVTVGEISFTPFSGPLTVLPSPVSPLFSTGSDLPGNTEDACASASVSISQGTGCSAVTVSAVVSGLSSPVYNWSNGNTSASVIVSTTDTLSLVVTGGGNCCVFYDTIVPVFTPTTPVNIILPADTALCLGPGESIVINASVQNNSGALSYAWSDGSAASTLTVTSSGIYWLDLSDDCSTDSDTITVTVLPAVSLQNATLEEVCSDDFPVTLTPLITNADYQEWSDGSAALTLLVSSPGIYQLEAGNSCGTDSISITVTEISQPEVTVDAIDTCVSEGTEIILSPVYTNTDNMLWSNGATTAEITIGGTGTYSITAQNACGSATASCQAVINNNPELSLPATLDTCLEAGAGFYYTATGTPGDYLWGSGNTTATEWISGEGVYTCSLTNTCGTVTRQMVVSYAENVSLWIPEDSVLFCSSALPVPDLGIETDYELYLENEWGTPVGTVIEEAGWYTVIAYNSCSTVTDSVFVDLREALFYLPNAFTPNSDAYNELYTWKGENVVITEVLIFNRWGEVVHAETNRFQGWDGRYNGRPCPDGIYQVIVRYRDCFGVPAEFSGHVTLLR